MQTKELRMVDVGSNQKMFASEIIRRATASDLKIFYIKTEATPYLKIVRNRFWRGFTQVFVVKAFVRDAALQEILFLTTHTHTHTHTRMTHQGHAGMLSSAMETSQRVNCVGSCSGRCFEAANVTAGKGSRIRKPDASHADEFLLFAAFK